MLLSVAALYAAATSSVFGYRHLQVDGAAYTTPEAVAGQLGIADGSNLFALRTDGLAGGLRQLATVTDAEVSVALPDTLRVRLHERTPILVWTIGTRRYLVDRDGVLFADAAGAPTDAVVKLRWVDDQRAESTGLALGGSLHPVDLAAAAQLGSVTPAEVGSAAAGLAISLDDTNGFVVGSGFGGWQATFGFYTPSLRTTELIPGQVRLLRSLIAKVGEAKIGTIILADGTNGTYTVKTR
jgi:hypothetical protein